jgi:hypothetical protein
MALPRVVLELAATACIRCEITSLRWRTNKCLMTDMLARSYLRSSKMDEHVPWFLASRLRQEGISTDRTSDTSRSRSVTCMLCIVGPISVLQAGTSVADLLSVSIDAPGVLFSKNTALLMSLSNDIDFKKRRPTSLRSLPSGALPSIEVSDADAEHATHAL